jgi:hypothetical protein
MRTVLFVVLFISYNLYAGIGTGYSGVGSLPVELTNFSATVRSGNTEIRWVTATEKNNYGFEVQRSAVSEQHSIPVKNWSKIGFIEGCGTTNSPRTYSFTDPHAQPGIYLYRLKQLDRDGKFEYSTEVEVAVIGIPKEFALGQNYPNPFNPTTIITYSLPVSSTVNIEVHNVIGELIATVVNEIQEAGSYKVDVNAAGLSSGVYYYTLKANNFTATKIMVVLK